VTSEGRVSSPCPATYVHWPHAWPLVAGAMSGHWCDGVIPDAPCEADKCARKATAWHCDKSGVHWLACERHCG
jgi:hypothetical protein